MKRTMYWVAMTFMAVSSFFTPSVARAADLYPCTVNADCTEDAFPTLDKTCVKAYVCEAGSCTFVPDVEGCVDWKASVDCDDSNDCTADFATPWRAAKCSHIAWLKQGKACDDGNDCTLDTKCSAGVCGSGKPLACDDGNSCTDDVCDPDSGCDVVAMVCTNDGNDCTAEACNPATGTCATSNVAFGVECAVGMVCNGSGSCLDPECLVAADCGPSVSSCSGGIRSLNQWQCTAGTCVLGTEPEFAFPCEFGCDGDVCGAADNDCDDGDPCTEDSLEVIEAGVHGNCVHEGKTPCCETNADCANGTTTCGCENGAVTCTANSGSCVNNVCEVVTTITSCDDGNQCTTDGCAVGSCTHSPLDGTACTGGSCQEGVCSGPALSGTFTVEAGMVIQGAVGNGEWENKGTSVTFNNQCLLFNVLNSDGITYALGGELDADGGYCKNIEDDESGFIGDTPGDLGCVFDCPKGKTPNWRCGTCAVP